MDVFGEFDALEAEFDDDSQFDDDANSPELRQMAEAVTDEVIKAKAENREPSLPNGWSRERIASNLGKLMEDLDTLDDYVDMLDAVQKPRGVEDPLVEGLTVEQWDQIDEEGLESFLTQLSDGKVVLVAASVVALDNIIWFAMQ